MALVNRISVIRRDGSLCSIALCLAHALLTIGRDKVAKPLAQHHEIEVVAFGDTDAGVAVWEWLGLFCECVAAALVPFDERKTKVDDGHSNLGCAALAGPVFGRRKQSSSEAGVLLSRRDRQGA